VTLVDTSLWVEHLRRGHSGLATLLDRGEVQCHAFVIGELACGNLTRRAETLGLLATLPRAAMADHDEVLALVERARLAGRGLGWVDMHLLASARLSRSSILTLDLDLARAARDLGVAAS